MKPLLIGVDGGGSQTRAVLCDHAGHIFGRGMAGSSNFYAVGIEEAVSNISAAVGTAIAGCQHSFSLASCGLGLAGACSPTEIALLKSSLQPALAPYLVHENAPLVIAEDVTAAWAGAFGGEAGVICIAGTGANAYGVGTDGNSARADGLGPLLGDRGSGIRIGESVLRAACLSFDGAGPKTLLLPAVLAHFGLASVAELIGHVYAPNFSRAELANLVRVAVQAAEGGDGVARTILTDAGGDLAASVAAVVQKLTRTEGQALPVAPVGGVLENVGLVRAAFEDELRAIAHHSIFLQKPRFEPVVGAALLPRILS